MSNCNNQTKNTKAVNNSLSKTDITEHELKNEYYSYGVQEIKEFDEEIKLTDNFNDLNSVIISEFFHLSCSKTNRSSSFRSGLIESD